MRFVASGIVVVGLLAGAARGQDNPCKVESQRGIVTISAKESRRAGCIEALAQRSGLRVSGLANLHGTVTLELSTPLLGEAIRKLAGDASYTLVENADDPTIQSVSFTGGDFGVREKASRAVMTADALSGAVVEDVDTGIAEIQAPPEPATAAKGHARPDAAGVSPVQVTLED